MKRVALALTWDGARWPIRSLPSKARAFLGSSAPASAQRMAALLKEGQIRELRVCWVPRLRGGEDVLSVAFPTARRIGFMPVKTLSFGDILGVVYRRN